MKEKPAPPSSASSPPDRPGARLLVLLVIVLAALAVYHNTFSVPPLLDDESTILENPSLYRLWPLGPVLAPPGNIPSAGRPLLNLSFALNYAMGGTSVFSYHVINLLIHVLAGLTLFGLVRRTLILPSLRERFGRAAPPLAFAIALLWTLHPLLTESVTYLSQRAESLMGLFYLLTLYCFVRGASVGPTESALQRPSLRGGSPRAQESAGRQAPASRRQNFWYGSAIAACALGMTSKEVMVTAPVLVFLFDRTFLAGTFRAAWRQRWKLHLSLAATWLLLAWLMVHSHLQERSIGFGSAGFTWQTYALTECQVVVQYLKLALWPHPLVFDYGWELRVQKFTDALPSALLLGLLGAATLYALYRRPRLGFLGSWFFVILAPTSSVVPLGLQPMAESRMYLSMVAVAVLGATAAYAWLGRKSYGLLFALALGCGWLTVRRNADYRTAISLWTDTVTKKPGNARAHFHLASALDRAGQSLAAIAQYEAVVRLDPNYPEAHNNLGNVLLKVPGRLPDAIAHYEAAIRMMPADAVARNNLGCVLMNIPGRLADAVAQFEQAVKINPDAADIQGNLATALSHLPGRTADAITHYQIALRLNPHDISTRNNFGSVLMAIPGRLSEAISQFKTVLSLQPDSVIAHYDLGAALLKTPGGRSEAIAHFQEALRLQPDFAPARRMLAQLDPSKTDEP